MQEPVAKARLKRHNAGVPLPTALLPEIDDARQHGDAGRRHDGEELVAEGRASLRLLTKAPLNFKATAPQGGEEDESPYEEEEEQVRCSV